MRQRFPDFATVLKETEAASATEEALHRPHVNLAAAVFSAGFRDVSNPTRPPDNLAPLFDIQDAEPEGGDAAERERREIAERMESQSPEVISRELDLRPDLKRAELQRLRRSFAARNHPDRLPEEFRLLAEQRMKTANALLDKALARAPS